MTEKLTKGALVAPTSEVHLKTGFIYERHFNTLRNPILAIPSYLDVF